MNTTERQLLSQLDVLREGADPAEVRGVVAELRGPVDALDSNRQADRAVRALYSYVEAACREGAPEATDEQLEIENILAAALAVARRGGSVYVLSCRRSELDQLVTRIDKLSMWERNILSCLLFYVEEKLRQALDVAVRGTWTTPAVS